MSALVEFTVLRSGGGVSKVGSAPQTAGGALEKRQARSQAGADAWAVGLWGTGLAQRAPLELNYSLGTGVQVKFPIYKSDRVIHDSALRTAHHATSCKGRKGRRLLSQ